MPREKVNGVELAYEWAGAGLGAKQGADVVVLLNGIAMSISHWKALVELMGGFRFLLHDFRGQLLSPLTPGGAAGAQGGAAVGSVAGAGGAIRLEDHVEDLRALMERLGISRAHVVGTSYGAEVGMMFAAAYPRMTASLAVIDGVSELDSLLAATVEAWKAAALCDPVVFYRSIVPWNYSAAYITANAEALARREAAVAGLPRAYFESFAALCDAFLRINITPQLSRIACRTLVLVGEKDILKHAGFARIIAAGIPGARLSTIPGAGHAAVIEQPGAVCAAIEPFLREGGSHGR